MRVNNVCSYAHIITTFEVNKELHKIKKHLIVNPLPAVRPYQQGSVPEQELLPSINKSSRPAVNVIYGLEDEVGKIESDHEDSEAFEPIYSEIPKYQVRQYNLESQTVPGEKLFTKTPQKKEIDYGHISTREVAKFRPCIEN